MAMAKLLLVVIVALIGTTQASKPKITNIQFYMQDILSGPNVTAVQVAQRLSNYTGTDPIAALFGNVFVFDNVLTMMPDLNSTVVGRAHGTAIWSSLEEYSLATTATIEFTSAPYNNSSITIVGQNPYMNEVREVPIVGGTGIFRLVKGYVLMSTYSMSQGKNVVRYNVTIIHN